MYNDESQLYFDFDDYSDGESVCQEDLNFCAVQAIKNASAILDRFENLELLNVLEHENKIKKIDGHSSFVFRAVDSVTDKKVVLKCLDPLFSQRIAGISDIDTDIDYEKLFEWEDKILSELKNNRHTPSVIGRLSRAPVLIEAGGKTFSHTLSYIAIENLNIELKKAFFDNSSPSLLKYAKRLRLFCQILNAVCSVHGGGVFHRDLKPSNLMAKSGRQKDGVVLIDFASSCAEKNIREKIRLYPEKWHGTEGYASPEILCGLPPENDLASAQDMYSLGCMLYELFGCRTFKQKLYETNPGYIETLENCRIYPNDGNSFAERLEVYSSYLDEFSRSVRPVALGDEADIPSFIKQEIDLVIQRFTSFDWRKRPCKEDFPEIRRKLFCLSKIMENTHLRSEFKRRKSLHKKRLIEKSAVRLVSAMPKTEA